MRSPVVILSAILAAAPAFAWEFAARPVCTLAHEEAAVALRITYDPRRAEAYAITLTRPAQPWPSAGVFALDFAGPRPNTIHTDRHRLSSGGTELTVTDRGFGNLLDGLALNRTATALIADIRVPFSLDDAAEPVARFRDCAAALAV